MAHLLARASPSRLYAANDRALRSEANAARYVWLRDKCNHVHTGTHIQFSSQSNDPDAAIDAAIQADLGDRYRAVFDSVSAAADYLLRSHHIGGAVHGVLTSKAYGAPVFGVDDEAAHRRN